VVWGAYRLQLHPIEQAIRLELHTATRHRSLPGTPQQTDFRIKDSPTDGFVEIGGEPRGAEWIAIRFEALPGASLSETRLPDLSVAEWARILVSADLDVARSDDPYFKGTVTSLTRRVPETGSTAILLLVAFAPLGWLTARKWRAA
jgi:hypothetical protein